jgi:hypothetical protein
LFAVSTDKQLALCEKAVEPGSAAFLLKVGRMHLSRRTLRRCMAVVENDQEAKMDDRASSFFARTDTKSRLLGIW